MHEWALAEAISRYIIENYAGKAIKEVKICLGELQNVDEEVFVFSLRELLKTSGFENVSISVRRIPVSLLCRSCGFRWRLNLAELGEEVIELIHYVPEVVHSYTKCPNCGSRDFGIVSGRGIYLEGVVY